MSPESIDKPSFRYKHTDFISSVNGISSFPDETLISTVNGIRDGSKKAENALSFHQLMA